jgi:hypothetical protein
MTAGILDFTIEQGATFRRVLTWQDPNNTPINLTGYTARMHCREHVSATASFLELTNANSRISINGVAGQLTLLVDAATTAALTANSGVYDLEVESADGEVTRLLQGNLIIERNVTR